MTRLNLTRLAVLVAATVGLTLLGGLKAEDKPKPDLSSTDTIQAKPLSENVKKGLDYLAKQQQADGGWGQGGGWRVGNQGGRVDGAETKDPSDLGNTCITVLALVRAGNTPKEGKYARQVASAVEFICTHVEKSDEKSLYCTDVRGTQLQSKIGPYVDTFLTSMVLAELKGKMATEKGETQLVAALGKTIGKIEKNQQADGTFAGNTGWASVLSQGLANKGINRLAQAGVQLRDGTLDRIQGQVKTNFDDNTKTFKPSGDGTAGAASRYADPKSDPRASRANSKSAPTASAAPSDAGVAIYGCASNLTNVCDVANSLRKGEEKARETLASKNASKEDREKAEVTLKKLAEVEKLREDATRGLVKQLENPAFVQGFGSNGGEEFLSFMNISEALLLKGGDDWKKWDKTMTESLSRIQDRDGSWSGHHCITGKTFCTASALLVLMADRSPRSVSVKK